MALDLLDAVRPESILCVTQKPLENVSGRSAQLGLLWDGQCLLPCKNLLAGDAWFIGEERWVANKHFEKDGST